MAVFPPIPRAIATATIVALAFVAHPPMAFAASSAVECGQYSAYTAPDPSGPTDGSLTMASLPPWTVAADATVSAAVTANLPTGLTNGPTCLTVDRDDADRITALDFASHGILMGLVIFDTGSNSYVFADRLILPADVADGLPGLGVIFKTSAAANTVLTVAFDLDASVGRITAFDGTTSACGPGVLQPNGDALIGNATIAAAFLDADDLAKLQALTTEAVCATVETKGTIDPSDGNLTTTTTVEISAQAVPVPTPPPTSTLPSTPGRSAPGGINGPLLVAAAISLLASVAAAGRRGVARPARPFGGVRAVLPRPESRRDSWPTGPSGVSFAAQERAGQERRER